MLDDIADLPKDVAEALTRIAAHFYKVRIDTTAHVLLQVLIKPDLTLDFDVFEGAAEEVKKFAEESISDENENGDRHYSFFCLTLTARLF
jgi:hypothetical protein